MAGSVPAPSPGPSPYTDIWKYAEQPGDTYVGVPNDYKAYIGNVPQTYYPDYDLTGQASRYGKTQATPAYQPARYTYAYLQNLTALNGTLKMQQLQYGLYAAGLLKAGDFTPGYYDKATNAAMHGVLQQANINGMTPEQVIQANFGKGPAFGFAKASGGGGGGAPSTVVQRQITLTGRAGAFAALQNVLTQALGRDPTPQEVATFKRSLNAVEQTNPSVTTTHVSGGGASVSSTTKQSDVSPDYEAYQAAQQGQLGAEGSRFQSNQYVEVLKNMLGM